MVITGIREYFTLIGKKCPILLLFLWLHCKNKKSAAHSEKKQELFCILTVIAYLSLKCLGKV